MTERTITIFTCDACEKETQDQSVVDNYWSSIIAIRGRKSYESMPSTVKHLCTGCSSKVFSIIKSWSVE